jgi:hypothetical protein
MRVLGLRRVGRRVAGSDETFGPGGLDHGLTENLARCTRGEPLRNLVDPAIGY